MDDNYEYDDDAMAGPRCIANGIGLGLLFWIIMGALWCLMAGCTSVQRQAASDGRAGVDAIRQETGKYPVLGAKVEPILRGIDSNLCAAAATEAGRLPAPRMTTDAILADGEKYAAQAKAAEAEATKRWYVKLAAGISGALMLLLAAKALPTAPVVALLGRVPLVGGLLGKAYEAWALTRAEAAERAKAEALAAATVKSGGAT